MPSRQRVLSSPEGEDRRDAEERREQERAVLRLNIGFAGAADCRRAWAPPGLARNSEGWTRIILEKPFGRDLTSAHELNEIVSSVFDEKSVYRIDHYLGKETVQNIMMFRFGNSMFEPVWNRNYIEYIEITAAETLGVEGRAAFYEETGALRDMVANHLLQC